MSQEWVKQTGTHMPLYARPGSRLAEEARDTE